MHLLPMEREVSSGSERRAFTCEWAFKTIDFVISKFILEVLGGVGAVWGVAEAAALRTPSNGDQWRAASLLAGVFCFVRYITTLCDKKDLIPSGYEALATFLLVVWGGVGAVWGMAEIAGLRLNYPPFCHETTMDAKWAPGFDGCLNTYFEWRIVCCFFFAAFFFVYWQHEELFPSRTCPRVLVYLASLILEVFGFGGAIWGASEVCYARKGWSDTRVLGRRPLMLGESFACLCLLSHFKVVEKGNLLKDVTCDEMARTNIFAEFTKRILFIFNFYIFLLLFNSEDA